MTTPLQILEGMGGKDQMADYIGQTWHRYNIERNPIVANWKELRNYIFATDTTTTTNRSLPWKNSTTIPKLCQIRDNLHSNYISALFPNDEWMRWEAYSAADNAEIKRKSIEAYMSNKARTGHFRTEMSKLLLDYVDYGNCFATVHYEHSYVEDTRGKQTTSYMGPRILRVSPLDIVFNPLAASFKDSFKIIRSLKTIGELQSIADTNPQAVALQRALKARQAIINAGRQFGWEDLNKAEGMQIDGFGNYETYLQSEYVEVLTFYGDIYSDGKLHKGREIMIIDRMWVVEDKTFPSWLGSAPIFHCGWRIRPDNLWAMGPLENLVGMQYRLDHLENAKADAMDLAIMPPLVIQGEVEQFNWGPNAEIHIDENGAVTELARNVQWVIQADNSIDRLEMRMEQYAGAPREAMGIRTAGEKTKFEVQELQNAAGRIFQEKITHFEVELLEPALNAMLEVSKRNMDKEDVVRVMDDDIGANTFIEITKDDITASGKLRPIGARHFAAKSQLVQNITGLANTQLWQQIAPHVNTKNLTKMVEDMLNLTRYDLFAPNSAIYEGAEQQRIATMAQDENTVMLEQELPQ